MSISIIIRMLCPDALRSLIEIPLSDEGTFLRGDVRGFAGQTVDLALQGTMYIDDIHFIPVQIPEPGSLTILALGCSLLVRNQLRRNLRR